MKALLFVISFSFCQSLLCQVTFIIDSLPANHDYKKDIYISGNFEGWSGGKEEFLLAKNNNQYQITIAKLNDTISYKFTLGSWAFVECHLNGSPIQNREYYFKGGLDTIHVKIENWETESQKIKPSTASKKTYRFLQKILKFRS